MASKRSGKSVTERQMTVPSAVSTSFTVGLFANDVMYGEFAMQRVADETPRHMVDRLQRRAAFRRAYSQIAIPHGMRCSISFAAKAIDRSSAGMIIASDVPMSNRALYFEYTMVSVGFHSRFVQDFPDDGRPLLVDVRLSDDELVRSFRRMMAPPSGPCVKCGADFPKRWCPCRQVRYCSIECQRRHWKAHKAHCAPHSSDDPAPFVHDVRRIRDVQAEAVRTGATTVVDIDARFCPIAAYIISGNPHE
jgi:hypothetical protein